MHHWVKGKATCTAECEEEFPRTWKQLYRETPLMQTRPAEKLASHVPAASIFKECILSSNVRYVLMQVM